MKFVLTKSVYAKRGGVSLSCSRLFVILRKQMKSYGNRSNF